MTALDQRSKERIVLDVSMANYPLKWPGQWLRITVGRIPVAAPCILGIGVAYERLDLATMWILRVKKERICNLVRWGRVYIFMILKATQTISPPSSTTSFQQ